MPHSTVLKCAVTAGFMALIASWPTAPSLAQQSAATPAAKTAPATIDPNWLKLPADSGNAGKTPELKKPGEAKSKIELPDKLKFGNSELHFDTTQNDAITIPQTGIDGPDSTAAGSPLQMDKPSPSQPRYFGLRLTTPMH